MRRNANMPRIGLMSIILCFALASVHGRDKEIPATKLTMNSYLGPSLKFLYWGLFEQYAAILRQKYPEIMVEGDLYPPPNINIFLAQSLGVLKMMIIGCILSGMNIFNLFGQEQPPWWTWCINNKIYSCMMTFFVCNALEGQLVSTGAFEISFNDVPIWSKLETGRIPQPPELFQIIDNHLNFDRQS